MANKSLMTSPSTTIISANLPFSIEPILRSEFEKNGLEIVE
jgi:hypothetical protein